MEIKEQIEELKALLTGDLFQDGEVMQQIYDLKKQLNHEISKLTNHLTIYGAEVKNFTNLSKEEQQIIEVKYKSKRFLEMTDEELEVAILGLILKISVINGVNVPDKQSMPILVDEMKIQFRNKYDMLNFDEIMFAFRNIS